MRGLLLDVLMIGLIILGIGIPAGFINVGPISAQLESDLVFRTVVVIAFDAAILGLVLVLGLFKLNRMAAILAGLIIIESVVLGITAMDFGLTEMGILLIAACVLSMVMGWVIMRFFGNRARVRALTL